MKKIGFEERVRAEISVAKPQQPRFHSIFLSTEPSLQLILKVLRVLIEMEIRNVLIYIREIYIPSNFPIHLLMHAREVSDTAELSIVSDFSLFHKLSLKLET